MRHNQQRAARLAAALLLILVGALHQLRHPSSAWGAGVLVGVVAGCLLVALRAGQNHQRRIRL